MKNIKKANYYAVNSVPAWQKNALVRRICRHLYRRMITEWYYTSDGIATLRAHGKDPRVNPYPWPLCEPNFASWEEDIDAENYSLISDPANMVIKYSTSYCACMIYSETHYWLKTSSERDANNWITVLDQNGFNELCAAPEDNHKYVGILKDENAEDGHGLLVWFERYKDGIIEYSTYYNHVYVVSMSPPSRFIWVKIV